MTPHIADPRRYPNFVKTAEATTHDEGGVSFRTILHVTTHEAFTQTGRVGVFIGANPSRALSDDSDRTVNKVLWWLFAQGCSEFYVFNLSPYRATDAKDARRWLSEPENLALSQRVNTVAHDKFREAWSATKPPVILAGWGDCLGKHAEDLRWPFLMIGSAPPPFGKGKGFQAPLVYHLPLTKAGNPGHPLYPKLTNLLTRRGLP
jgi:hypothetical protein